MEAAAEAVPLRGGGETGGPAVAALEANAFTVPTERRESDGTLEWDSTTIVVVEVASNGERGLGYTYADAAVADVIRGKLAACAVGTDALAPPLAWSAM